MINKDTIRKTDYDLGYQRAMALTGGALRDALIQARIDEANQPKNWVAIGFHAALVDRMAH